MLTRRAFHQSLMALAMTTALPRAAMAISGNSDDVFLNRLTFGATEADRAALTRMGRAAWLDAQLTRAPDPALDQRLADARLRISYEAGDNGEGGMWKALDELRPFTTLFADPATFVALADFERFPEEVGGHADRNVEGLYELYRYIHTDQNTLILEKGWNS